MAGGVYRPLASFCYGTTTMSPWRKTFYASWVAQVISVTGFTFVLPFLPLYIRTLGVETDQYGPNMLSRQ